MPLKPQSVRSGGAGAGEGEGDGGGEGEGDGEGEGADDGDGEGAEVEVMRRTAMIGWWSEPPGASSTVAVATTLKRPSSV